MPKNLKKDLFRTDKRTAVVTLVSLLTLLIVVQSVLLAYVLSSLKYNRERIESDRTAQMLVRAIDGLSSEAVIEPISKNVYLPDAGLVLPAYGTDVTGVRYQYSKDATTGEEYVQLTTSSALRQALSQMLNASARSGDSGAVAAVYDITPQVQACSRGVTVLINHKNPNVKSEDGQLAFSKTLKDGRAIRAYGNTKCQTSSGQNYDFAPLVAYLKNIDSY